MDLKDLLTKVITALVIAYMVAISGLIIKVNTLENKAATDEKEKYEYRKDASELESKQWEFILNTNKAVVQLDERQKHKLDKEQYYRENK